MCNSAYLLSRQLTVFFSTGGGRRSSGFVKSLPAAERLNIFTILRLSGTLRPAVPGRVSNLCTKPSLCLLGRINTNVSAELQNYSTRRVQLNTSNLEIKFELTSPLCQYKQTYTVVSGVTRNSYRYHVIFIFTSHSSSKTKSVRPKNLTLNTFVWPLMAFKHILEPPDPPFAGNIGNRYIGHRSLNILQNLKGVNPAAPNRALSCPCPATLLIFSPPLLT